MSSVFQYSAFCKSVSHFILKNKGYNINKEDDELMPSLLFFSPKTYHSNIHIKTCKNKHN